jgi:hypothetical protein
MTLGTGGLDETQTVSVSDGDLKTSLDNLKTSIDLLKSSVDALAAKM